MSVSDLMHEPLFPILAGHKPELDYLIEREQRSRMEGVIVVDSAKFLIVDDRLPSDREVLCMKELNRLVSGVGPYITPETKEVKGSPLLKMLLTRL